MSAIDPVHRLAYIRDIQDLCRQSRDLTIIQPKTALHFVSSGKVLEEIWYTGGHIGGYIGAQA